MSSTRAFQLSRATASDLPEMCELMYNCFSPLTRRYYMGCETLDDLPKYIEKCTRLMNEDPTDIWIKVVDAENGKIISISDWKLYLGTEKAVPRRWDEPPDWVRDERVREDGRKYMDLMNGMRIKANPEPFLHLYICCTSSDYRRRGAGGMMMRWGNELADSLFIRGWVEASKDGTALYEQFGYHEVETVDLDDGTLVAMRRDARSTPTLGGRPKPDEGK